MNLRQEDLQDIAKTAGFRAEMLEKVIRLIELLNELFDNTFLKQRLALKGGTALNLFYFNLPRLSVDIDLNYIGSVDRNIMIEERKELEAILISLCERSGFTIKRVATEHAGGKWRLNYVSVVQPGGNLEVDLSYLYRVVFWPIAVKDSCLVGQYQAKNIPLLDIHELAAGKLAALMSRRASRDLYDAHRLLVDPKSRQKIDMARLRLAFVIYGGMNRHDWRTIKIEDIGFDSTELQNKLIPVLNQNDLQQTSFAERLVTECQDVLSHLLPFNENEKSFFDRLLDEGEIESSLLTSDTELQKKINLHPGLLWKAQNVKQFKAKK
ncbi:MAG TPA: nucleotidyl transferase AbiEii/AbiGii toxin family protein [Gammaproteobacteria bacterium]|jgi:hypothetical protein|nr:nucleotidyl transferase AbiEii/AbiGii toxin family protein [Gammaproteobacteria bacterium]